jgi:hypothetical protein
MAIPYLEGLEDAEEIALDAAAGFPKTARYPIDVKCLEKSLFGTPLSS